MASEGLGKGRELGREAGTVDRFVQRCLALTGAKFRPGAHFGGLDRILPSTFGLTTFNFPGNMMRT